jgi:hypothetical protein
LDAANVIKKYVVVFGLAVCIRHDPFEDFMQRFGFNFQAGFFQYFAADCIRDAFSDFEEPAWEGPEALEGLFAALNQQDVVLTVEDQCADAKQRAGRVAAVICQTGCPRRLP